MSEETKSNKIVEFFKTRWKVLLVCTAIIAVLLAAGIYVFNLKSDGSGETSDEVSNTQTAAASKEITGVDELSFESGDNGPKMEAKIEALQADQAGLSPETAFRITLPAGYDQEYIKQSLTVNPAIAYALEKDSASFILTPKQPLEPNKVYSFRLMNEKGNLNDSWAFQTRRDFKINSTLPRDKATGVPVNTGVEIAFSHEGVSGLDDYFTISPSVPGKFEYHKNTAVFVPEALANDTIYTVTIKKGLKLPGTEMAIQSDLNFQFQTEPLKQNNYHDDYFYVYNDFNAYPSDTAPYFDISVSTEQVDSEVGISVYRYSDSNQYLQNMEGYNKRPRWAAVNEADILPDTASLEKVFDDKVKIVSVENPWYTNYLILPEPLPEGQYFVAFTLGDHKAYTFMQINDILAYVNVGDEKTLCWLNDNVTGEAVSGALVEGNGFSAATSDQGGVALIEGSLGGNPDQGYVNLKITRDGHPPLIATVPTSSSSYYYDYYEYGEYSYYSYGSSSKKNWIYFYLDRSVYLPSDTVSIWGLVKPRKGEDPFRKLTLSLEGYSYSPGYGYDQATLVSTDVDVSEYGTFTTSVSYKDLESGSYELVLRNGEEILNSQYFYIEPYVKPQYTVSVNADKTAVMADEDVTFDIQAKFFEGTPVSGLKLNYNAYNSLVMNDGSTNGTVTLDESGRYALVSAAKVSDAGLNGLPQWEQIYVTAANPEESELSGNGSVIVFPRDVTLDASGTIKNKVASMHFETYGVDLTEVNKTGSLYNDDWEPAYRGAPYDATLKVTVYEDYWVKKETGSYYDFISKKSYKTYDYEQQTNTLGTFEASTSGGKADYSYDIPSYSVSNSYRFVVDTTDSKNRAVQVESYLYREYMYNEPNEEFDPYYYLALPNDDYEFKVGETVSAQVLKNNAEFQPQPGQRILFLTLQEGITNYSVQDTAVYSFAFDGSMIPNAYVYAVIFDGRNIKRTYTQSIRYDTADEKLNISVTTDKDQYRPGENVEAAFRVTDTNGNPCSAEINLSVVDEAYFALFGQSVDILGNLYQSVYDSGINSEYISYTPFNKHYFDGAECGEGEDEGAVRKNFKDNAFFGSIRTDSSGSGKFSFKLPDNLTSWRLTYQAVTDDLKAGNGTVNINAKLPFFLQLVSGKNFMEGDIPTFLARCYGTELKSDEPVQYTLEVQNPGGAKSNYKASGKASDPTALQLPKLSEGKYIVTVRAENGGHEDAIQTEINVVKSMLEGAMTKYFDLSNGMKLDFTDSMTTLTFYNKGLLAYYNMLWRLSWSWGDRIDEVLSRKVAKEQLVKYFGEDFTYYYDEQDIMPYQQDDGGIALLTYGSSDPELSAKIASIESGFDNNALKGYFYKIVNDETQTPVLAAAAYWGLAALHEPVLFELNGYLESLASDPQFSLKEKLYMALAFADIGDYDTAEKIYKEVMGQYKADSASLVFLETNGGKDDNLTATALCDLLALKLDMPEKNGMFTYLTRKSADEVLLNLEKLVYITNVLPRAAQKSSFTVSAGGKTENVQLEGIKSYTMMLMPGELKKMKISNVEGSPVVMVSYTGPLAELQGGVKAPVEISRRYLVDDKETSKFSNTDLIMVEMTVQFDENAPEGYYDVTDVLPAGLRYAYSSFYSEDGYYYGWSDPEGQIVKMGCYYRKNLGTRILRYYARVVAPGVYTADSACVKDSKSDTAGFTKPAAITIGE